MISIQIQLEYFCLLGKSDFYVNYYCTPLGEVLIQNLLKTMQVIGIKEAREILWPAYANINDSEIQALIDLLYGVCNHIIDEHMQKTTQ